MSQPLQTERTTVRREPHRGVYDRETIYAILDAGFVCHMGFVHDGHPFVIPTSCWRIDDHLYVHGSSASRMLRNLGGGLEVCVTVTFIDGLVLARSAFNHSVNYRSVVVLGKGTLLATDEEKIAALEAFTERLTPGRWREIRYPNERELKATSVFKVPLTEASAKVRQGAPEDDADDYAVNCWAGVIPFETVCHPPVPDPKLREGIATPEYATHYVGPGFWRK
jgi:nitroimidazol reductase NimA-like FMN-containing flavoprotein (pyridoxamine 5'-phosphate oxidase superfamily)